MSDQTFKPWFRAYLGQLGFLWWPVSWQGFLFALAIFLVCGLSLALIVQNIVSPPVLLLAEAIPTWLAMRVFLNHTEWTDGRSRRSKRDLRN